MKKMLAMILVMAMMLALSVSAFAESAQTSTDDSRTKASETAHTGGSDVWSDPGFYPIRHNFDDWRDY